jgi:predicted nucleotidyltransferase
MLDVTSDQLELVRSILSQFVPGSRVVAFGSRATGNSKPFSDLDLVIYSRVPLAIEVLANLRMAFSESNLPFKVDLIESHELTPQFLQSISKSGIQILP